jgi:hypothetical protein
MNWKNFSYILLAVGLIVAGIGILRYERRLKINEYPEDQTEVLRKAIRIDPFLAHTLYQMMRDAHEVFEVAQITYWVDSGTYLGAIRHAGIIPWDDDLDIATPEENKEKIARLETIFDRLGYLLYPCDFGFKISPKIAPEDCNEKGELYPALDIFLFRERNQRVEQSGEKARKMWPNGWYTPESIASLKLTPFGSLQVYAPSDANAYFSRMYAADWSTTAVFTHRHRTNFLPAKFKWNLRPDDLAPAQPADSTVSRIDPSIAASIRALLSPTSAT